MKAQLVLFGATGDLSTRKLFPALENIIKYDPNILDVISVGRKKREETTIPSFSSYFQGEMTREEDLDKFLNTLSKDIYTIFFLAIPPQLYNETICLLSRLSNKHHFTEKAIIIEKPFGHNLQTAKNLNDILLSNFSENEIYRIDHYLGKKGMEKVLNYDFTIQPSSIHITALETLGIQNRAEYYEHQGALKDMVQNHLLQVTATLLSPSQDGSIHKRKANIIKNLTPITVERKQYIGYKDERNVSPHSATETYVKLTLNLNQNPLLLNVPIILETGKKMIQKESTIEMNYADHSDFIELVDGEGVSGSYETLILNAIQKDQSNYVSTEEILAQWELIEESERLPYNLEYYQQ